MIKKIDVDTLAIVKVLGKGATGQDAVRLYNTDTQGTYLLDIMYDCIRQDITPKVLEVRFKYNTNRDFNAIINANGSMCIDEYPYD